MTVFSTSSDMDEFDEEFDVHNVAIHRLDLHQIVGCFQK